MQHLLLTFCRLAAVDMHTAQHLVGRCLTSDLARDRTIILVTHHISLCLPVASYLVELANGKVLRQGSIQELADLDLLRTVVEQEDEPTEIPQTPANEADALTDVPVKFVQQKSNGKLIEAEARAEGRVSIRTYITYIRAAGIIPWLLTIGLMLLIRFINIGNQVSIFLENILFATEPFPTGFLGLLGRGIPTQRKPSCIPFGFLYQPLG